MQKRYLKKSFSMMTIACLGMSMIGGCQQTTLPPTNTEVKETKNILIETVTESENETDAENSNEIVIGHTNISLLEYTVYYNFVQSKYDANLREIAAQYGFTDESGNITDLSSCLELKKEQGVTWQQYIHEETMQYLRRVITLCELADANGYHYVYDTLIDEVIANVKINADVMKMDVKQYLKEFYGAEGSIEDLKNLVERYYFADMYYKLLCNQVEISDKEIDAYYDEHMDEIRGVTYYDFITFYTDVTVGTDIDGNYVMQEVNMEKNRERAEKTAAVVSNCNGDLAVFQKLASEYAEKGMKEYYQSPENFQVESRECDTAEIYQEWLFDNKRSYGDTAVFVDRENMCVHTLFFDHQGINDSPIATVAIIQIEPKDGQLKNEGLAKIQDIFDQWKRLGQNYAAMQTINVLYENDEDYIVSFYYTDMASISLFTDKVSQWVFNPNNEKNDNCLLRTDTGFYGVTFIEFSQYNFWQAHVVDILQREAIETQLAMIMDSYI